MTHRWSVLSVAVALLLITAGCARGLHGPSLNTKVKPAPRDLDELSVTERRAILDRAQLWRPIATESLDLLRGPAGEGAYAFDAKVECEFHFPDEPLSGMTPKFDCDVAPSDTVKVKYGENNGEVFAEVAASRLFWALGFLSDRMYPVKVQCRNCPENPHRASTSAWRTGKPKAVADRLFDPAAIERKFGGEEVEVPGYEGWSWRELEQVGDNSEGASRTHVDALKLLAAMIQHVDSKPENQALICAEAGIRKDAEGNETCAQPYLIVKDLGSSFAAASKITFPKMKLESWRGVPVWRDARACQAHLTSSFVGTLEHPRIGEAGRDFLAKRLELLSDQQLRDLFTAARVERREDQVDGRQATAEDWVAVFKAKRAEIAAARCPT